MNRMHVATFALSILLSSPALAERVGADSSEQGRIKIKIDGQTVAEYVFQDDEISRPYFASVKSPSGLQVTRNRHPVKGTDLTDHPKFHPGVWMTFGDISDNDYWRLKARTIHDGIAAPPVGGWDQVDFTVKNRYLQNDDPKQTVCNEICRLTFRIHPQGYLLLWDSTFSSPKEFYFGDQEEMGLGFRVATLLRAERQSKKEPLVPPGTGTIIDAAGNENESGVWGKSSPWCNYMGTISGQRAGIAVFCHPDNLRPSWYHARDRGYIVANMFGRAAMGHGKKSRIIVKPGESLRLRYGVLFHSGDAGSNPDLQSVFDDYVRLARD